MSALVAHALFAVSIALTYRVKEKENPTPIITRPRRVSSTGVPYVPDSDSPLTQLQELEKSRSRVYYFFRETDLDRGIDYTILALRPLGLLRPAKDVIILPDHPKFRQAWKAFVKFLGYEEWQVIWVTTSEACVMQDLPVQGHVSMLQQAAKRLRDIYEKPKDFLVFPYIVTENLYDACQLMLLTVIGDRIACIPNKASIYDLFVPKRAKWLVPKGAVCSAEELLENYAELSGDCGDGEHRSKKKFLIKPCNGQGGMSITRVSTYAEAKLAMGDYIAAQQLYVDSDMSVAYGMMSDVNAYNIEEEIQGVEKTIVVVSIGATIVAISDQLSNGFTHIGNVVPSTASQDVIDECVAATQSIQSQINLQGFWGLDFVVAPDKDGHLRPVVVDLNVGRLCGGHYPYLFAKNHGLTFASYVSGHVPDNMSDEDRQNLKESIHTAGVWQPESGIAYAALNRRIEYVLEQK